MAGLGLPDWLTQVLCHRGITDPGQAREFLEPDLGRLPSFQGLRGLNRALEVLIPAIRQGLTIGVAGDYDTDGVSATALMVDFLRQLGANVTWHLPHRLHDGYGFKPRAARSLAEAGAQVVITVDCGISDHQGVTEANSLGLQVVITDHHQIPPGPPVPAAAIIDPNQDNCALPTYLSGVGVAFYLAAGLRAALRDDGFFQNRPEPNLRQCLDLVALGTCADVSPMVGANRIFVNEGLKLLNQKSRLGLRVLAEIAQIKAPWETRDLGFGLVPRLNAAGRLDHPSAALELLLATDTSQAQALAQTLDQLNQERKQVEAQVFSQALEQLEADPESAQAPFLILAQEGWHKGVLGIVASRLLEHSSRPVMLFTLENGMAVGSGRSRPGFHLQKALAQSEELFVAFGGHSLAAGATLPKDQLPRLAQSLIEAAAKQLPPPGQAEELEIEAQVDLSDLGATVMEPLSHLAPFGPGNPEPLLALPDVQVTRAWEVGAGHLKMEISQGRRRAQAIGFNKVDLMPPEGSPVDIAFIPR
ncbi:MAG: single-stranded-DNA-specific exonuclease RecJ, partial [Desulfarculaceae bacterium]